MVEGQNDMQRTCRICGETKPLTDFRTGPQGRKKSLCLQCTDDLIRIYLGPGLRKCATCKRPTTNYRCGTCWKKMRTHSEFYGPELDETYPVRL